MISELERKYIIERLSDKHINISEIARKTGISKVSIYNIKNGKQIPTERTYQQIIEITDKHLIKKYDERFEELTNEMKGILKNLNSNLTFVISKEGVFSFENLKMC